MGKKKKIELENNGSKAAKKVRAVPDLIMKISDLELVISKMKSLGIQEFKVETSKGASPETSNLYFYFLSRDFVSFQHFRDYKGFGRVVISYCEGPDIQHDHELLSEKRALIAYIGDGENI